MSGATTGVRQDAMRRAMDLMQSVPPSHVKEWMAKVFSSDSLGPAALEIIAIKAMSMRDLKLDVEQRAQAILTMKEAVDTLLSGTTVDAGSLRVPLRMLTTALVGEIETTVTDKGRDRTMARETELLLRALPSDRWLDMIEPSLSTRASKASIAISMIASKSEQAIAILAGALKRAPDQATDLADHFLVSWEARLNPKNDRSAEDEMFMYGWRPFVPAAPLTRGRQRRNLDRLNELLAIVQEFGVDSRQLPSVTAVFKACHSKTEVYFRGDIEHVFGPVVAIAPSTAFALAEGMRTSLNGDWRNREAQKAAGINRSANEIAALVDKGYGLAIELIDRALAEHPASWRYASSKAALSYERLQFKQTQQKQDASTYDAYRKDAFLAFAGAAAQYARVIERGEEREDPGVYVNWFAAAIGSSELNYLNRDDILVEGTKQTDQVDLIRAAILSLPSDSTDRHLSAFARAVEAGVGRAQPEMKPRVVKHALRVIADHPSGATLRSMDELYRDLLKGEIRLRLTVDGDDHVGVARSFGALLSLRYTNAVDRETGGFAKYLQNNVWGLVGGQYRSINYRDQLQKSIESAFKDSFDVEGIGFFEAFTPGRSVSENGEDGWQEKPLAYLVLKRKDPSIDRTPTLTMDMYFADQTGPVTLAVQCNTPVIVPGTQGAVRPVRDLEVSQIVDLRRLRFSEGDKAVTLEVRARGKGVVPELADLLTNVDAALPGYAVSPTGIETRPTLIEQSQSSSSNRFFSFGPTEPPKEGYPEPDENGMYRLPTERTWLVTYTPTGGAIGGEFRLPVLKEGANVKLVSKQYSDMDVVNVTLASIPVNARFWTMWRLAYAGVALVALVLGGVWFSRRKNPVKVRAAHMHLPDRVTPLSVVTTLRRINAELGGGLDSGSRAALVQDITELERKYFGRESTVESNGDLTSVLSRWSSTITRE
jgi:hypothetical protein